MERNPRIFRVEEPLTLDRQAALETLRQLAQEMAGKKLPGERELAQRLAVSRQRVRQMLDVLETEQVVLRRQGSGTYAVDTRSAELVHLGLVLDAGLQLGNDPFVSLIMERLQWCLQASGIHCVVERTDGTARPRFLGDGILTLGMAGLEALSFLRPGDPPAVSLLAEERYAYRFTRPVSLLMVEDRGAGFAAATRAMDEGATRLVFLGRQRFAASRLRWEGVQAAVEKKQRETNAAVTAEFEECGMNYNAGLSIAGPLNAQYACDGAVDGTALIAANDWMAVGLRAGLMAVGSALSGSPLYSFDGLTIARDPALAIRSLRFPTAAFVEDALAELKRLHGGHQGRVCRYALEWSDEETKTRKN